MCPMLWLPLNWLVLRHSELRQEVLKHPHVTGALGGNLSTYCCYPVGVESTQRVPLPEQDPRRELPLRSRGLLSVMCSSSSPYKCVCFVPLWLSGSFRKEYLRNPLCVSVNWQGGQSTSWRAGSPGRPQPTGSPVPSTQWQCLLVRRTHGLNKFS